MPVYKAWLGDCPFSSLVSSLWAWLVLVLARQCFVIHYLSKLLPFSQISPYQLKAGRMCPYLSFVTFLAMPPAKALIQRFLPKEVKGARILVEEGTNVWRVTNDQLKSAVAGIGRSSLDRNERRCVIISDARSLNNACGHVNHLHCPLQDPMRSSTVSVVNSVDSWRSLSIHNIFGQILALIGSSTASSVLIALRNRLMNCIACLITVFNWLINGLLG